MGWNLVGESRFSQPERQKLLLDPEGLRLELLGLSVLNLRDGLMGTVVEGENRGWMVWCPTEGDGHVHPLGGGGFSQVTVEHDDTRDRLARWCADVLGWTPMDSTAPAWQCLDQDYVNADESVLPAPAWILSWGDQLLYCTPEEHNDHPDHLWVPGLGGLLVVDPRRLADGSRWVDAVALRELVLELARGSRPKPNPPDSEGEYVNN